MEVSFSSLDTATGEYSAVETFSLAGEFTPENVVASLSAEYVRAAEGSFQGQMSLLFSKQNGSDEMVIVAEHADSGYFGTYQIVGIVHLRP